MKKMDEDAVNDGLKNKVSRDDIFALLTKESWPEYVMLGSETYGTTNLMYGYRDAIVAVVYALKKNSADRTPEEVQAMLIAFIEQQEELIRDIDEKWYEAKEAEIEKQHDAEFKRVCGENPSTPI